MARDVAEPRSRRSLTQVRAAGGLVVRDGRVLLVHRPRYDDWTFPKGKALAGETDEECALREVEEETGISCEIVSPDGTTRYADARGRDKTVHWFVMRPLRGAFEPNDEVDELRWVDEAEAAQLLTYDRDRVLLDRLP
jgi:8-oxo-dGTP diphosphatase